MNPAVGASLLAGFMLAARALRPSAARRVADTTPSVRRLARRPSGTTASASDCATFLDTTSTEVRSGASLIGALAQARVRHPFLAVQLDALEGRCSPDVAIVRQSIAATLELGGPVAATLHHAAALLRQREAQRAEAKAHSAQARLSAKVLTGVPLLFAFWSATTSSSFRQAITSPLGLVATLAGVASNTIGWWWMRHIVDKAMP